MCLASLLTHLLLAFIGLLIIILVPVLGIQYRKASNFFACPSEVTYVSFLVPFGFNSIWELAGIPQNSE